MEAEIIRKVNNKGNAEQKFNYFVYSYFDQKYKKNSMIVN